MKKWWVTLIRLLWAASSFAMLIFSLKRLSELDSIHDVSELISIMTFGMVLISFPTGVMFCIALIVFISILNYISHIFDNKYISTIVTWSWLFWGGKIQWFNLIDKILNKFN